MNSPSDEELGKVARAVLEAATDNGHCGEGSGEARDRRLYLERCWSRYRDAAPPPTVLSLLHRLREAREALVKIDAIRNSIIGCQRVNFSEHVYPLVAALGAAGFPGAGYETARENVGTLIERTNAAEARAERAEALLREAEARNSSYESSHGSTASPKTDGAREESWREGAAIIEKCLARAVAANYLDAPFPLDANQARLWHRAQAEAFQHSLEMMGPPCPAESNASSPNGAAVSADSLAQDEPLSTHVSTGTTEEDK